MVNFGLLFISSSGHTEVDIELCLRGLFKFSKSQECNSSTKLVWTENAESLKRDLRDSDFLNFLQRTKTVYEKSPRQTSTKVLSSGLATSGTNPGSGKYFPSMECKDIGQGKWLKPRKRTIRTNDNLLGGGNSQSQFFCSCGWCYKTFLEEI